MKNIRVLGLFLAMVALSFFGGCFGSSGTKGEVEKVNAKDSISRVGVATKYASVFLRGTFNNWGKLDMILTGDYQREATVYFNGVATDRFKVDVSGNWTEAYPAADYMITGGAGNYVISFNETTKVITVKKVDSRIELKVSSATILKGDTTFALPTEAMLIVPGQTGDTKIESWTPALDVNKVGVTVYTATANSLKATFTLTVNDTNPGFKTNYANGVFFRGTANNWALGKMDLTADYTRETTVFFGGAATDRFKVDVSGNWTISYPTADYMITGGAGDYVITFNETTKNITVVKKSNRTTLYLSTTTAIITKGDATFTLPAKATASQSGADNSVDITWTPALDVNKIGDTVYTATYQDAKITFTVTVKDTNTGFKTNYPNGVYLRGTSNGWGLKKMDLVADYTWQTTAVFTAAATERFKIDVSGNWTTAYPATDYMIALGAGEYTITFNETTKQITVVKKPAGKGIVNVTVYADSVVSGKIVSTIVVGALIYADNNPYNEGNLLGTTGVDGSVQFEAPVGELKYCVVKDMGAKSSIFTMGFTASVVSGQVVSVEAHVAPISVSVICSNAPEAGKAFYITGQTSYLGDWKKAYKLTKRWDGKYAYSQIKLPIGAEYKIVKAADNLGDVISTTGVVWETGANHVIAAPYQYYESVNNITPIF